MVCIESKNIPHKTSDKVEMAIVQLRHKHNNWGAIKSIESG